MSDENEGDEASGAICDEIDRLRREVDTTNAYLGDIYELLKRLVEAVEAST